MKAMKADDSKCPWKNLEDNYRKYVPIESSIKPLFYNLSSPDFNCQEIPKLDGLVSNVVFSQKDPKIFEFLKNWKFFKILVKIYNFFFNSSNIS